MREILKGRSLHSVPGIPVPLASAIVIPGAVTRPKPGEHGFPFENSSPRAHKLLSLSPLNTVRLADIFRVRQLTFI